MTPPREEIYGRVFAFFAALASGGAPLFRSATRSPRTWDTYRAEDSPALWMRESRENAKKEKFRPTAWTFYADLFLFVHTGAGMDSEIVVPTLVNPLLDVVTAVFEIDDPQTGECTLQGLVTSAAIDGTIHKYLSNLGDEAVVHIPIMVRVTK